MAVIERKEVKEQVLVEKTQVYVDMRLTEDEAKALFIVLSSVGGSPNVSPRKLIDGLWIGLRSTFPTYDVYTTIKRVFIDPNASLRFKSDTTI